MSIFQESKTPFSSTKTLNLGEEASTWTFGDWRDECATLTPFLGFDCSQLVGQNDGDKGIKHHFNTYQKSECGYSGLECDTSSMLNSECSDSCFESGLVHKKVFKIQKFPKKSRAFLSNTTLFGSEGLAPTISTTISKKVQKSELRRDVLHKCILRSLRKFFKTAFKDIVVSKRRKHCSKDNVLENLRSEISKKLLSFGLDIPYSTLSTSESTSNLTKASNLPSKMVMEKIESGKLECSMEQSLEQSLEQSVEHSEKSTEILDVLVWMLSCKSTLNKLPVWFEGQKHVRVVKEVFRTYSNSSLAALFKMNSIRPLFEYFFAQNFEKTSHPLLSENPKQAWQAINDFRNNFEKFQK